jgi:gluconate 2-dehydrogenase gamma chain
MPKNNATRREFLVRAAVGAGAVAGAGIVPDALAQNHDQLKQEDAAGHASQHLAGGGQGAFFNHEDSATIAAFTERLMPGAPDKPGAREVGVLNYIDLALSGAYQDLQDFYRRGLAQMDAYCRKTFKQPFARLEAGQMDEVIRALEEGKATGFTWPSAQEFFNTVRTHTIEGMFADPIYGGNKDFAGWRLVGFPGAQAIFTPTDLQSKQAFVRAPMIGLQDVAKAPIRRQ